MAKYRDKPGYSFKPGTPPEVKRFFENKSIRRSFSWKDVEPTEHAVSFTVARAMQIDVLNDIQSALKTALSEGVPFDQFKKDLRPRLRKLGWWGVKEQVDPLTGKARPVRLGSPRRLKTIYNTNMRSARAAGQWERIERTQKTLPYLVYGLGPSERHRPHHQSKAGLVLPVNDPFWQTWYPPNGWNCKCHVRQISKTAAEQRGISQSPETPMRDVFNNRTGEIKRIPSGIDAGFEINPGLYRRQQMERFLAGKLDGSDPTIAFVAAKDMASSWRFARIYEGSAGGSVPVAMLPSELATAISAQTRVVQFSDYTATKTRKKHAEAKADEFLRIAEMINTGSVAHQSAANGTQSLIIQSKDAAPWRLVLKRTQAGNEIFVSTFHRATAAKWAQLLRNKNITVIRE